MTWHKSIDEKLEDEALHAKKKSERGIFPRSGSASQETSSR
ncbi:MAG: hypothetical protein WCB53_14120 [Terriglobales bacterium]